jgi:hypothetical protein
MLVRMLAVSLSGEHKSGLGDAANLQCARKPYQAASIRLGPLRRVWQRFVCLDQVSQGHPASVLDRRNRR